MTPDGECPDPHALADDEDDLDWDVDVQGRMREAATRGDDAVLTVPYTLVPEAADEVD